MLLAFRARSLTEPELKRGKSWHSRSYQGISNTPITATSASDWCKSAEGSVRTLSLHLERINNLHSRYIGLQDLGGCISIKGSNIIALVAVAEIYYHLSRNPAFPRTEEAQTRFLTAMEHVVAAVKELRIGNHLQKVHVYTGVRQGGNIIRNRDTNRTSFGQFSLCLAINICSREMASRHCLSPSEYPTFPHVCNLQGCLGVHIGLLTGAYQTLSGVTLRLKGSSG